MLVVGLTGGIGSGKSTVAEQFAQLGVPVIDADVLAKALLKDDKHLIQQVIAHFGTKIVAANGQIDRSKLAKIIFRAPSERRWLEQLLHPVIRSQIVAKLATLTVAYCIVVIPLLLENGVPEFIDRVLVVDVPEDIQIARVQQRDQKTVAEVQAILQAQIERAKRLQGAQDVLTNEKSLADLAVDVKELHKKYLKIAQQK